MKICFLSLMVLAFVAEAAPLKKGQVLCSVTAPQQGFTLVSLRDTGKTYSGSFDVSPALRITANYQTQAQDLELSVWQVNADEETQTELLSTSVVLPPGQFWKLKLNPEINKVISASGMELICQVLWASQE
jgi:hypothetical protein